MPSLDTARVQAPIPPMQRMNVKPSFPPTIETASELKTFKIYVRADKWGNDRALYRAKRIGTGANALRDAARYLIETGTAALDDVLHPWRGKTFYGAVTVGKAAALPA